MIRWFLIASLLSCSSIALADPPSDELQEEVRTLVREANSLYEWDEFERSLELLTEAYALWASPELLYPIALCQKKLNRTEDAGRSVCTFLAQEPQTELRPKLEAELFELTGNTSCAPQTPQIQELPAPSTLTYEEPSIDAPPPLKSLLLPGALFVAGGLLGTSVFMMRLKEESGVDYTNADRVKGIVLSVSTDLLFISGGVSAWMVIRKQRQSEQ